MKKLKNGLYEELITSELDFELSSIEDDCKFTEKVDAQTAPTILADYAEAAIKARLEIIQENTDDVTKQVELINRIIGVINEGVDDSDDKEQLVSSKSEQLKAILLNDPLTPLTGKKAKDLVRPETSLVGSSLFTGAHREPNLDTEFNNEIASCDRIDMVVSFIRWSGVRLLLEALKAFTDKGNHLRIITTTYMGATEFKAIEKL